MYTTALFGFVLLNVTLPIYFVGKKESAKITVEGIVKPEVSINFGDGKWHDSRVDSSLFQFSRLSDIPPIITEITASHQFCSKGLFMVDVNITDGVSIHRHSSVATVVEEIAGIELVLLSPSLVALFENITVKAIVANGSDLVFDWDFGDFSGGQYTAVKNFNQSSIANHSYGVADTYHISVQVSNSYQGPIEVFLTQTIQSVERIEQLHLQMLPHRKALPLIKSVDSLHTFTTKPVVLEARLWRGSDVDFFFDFGDEVTEKVAIVHHVWPVPRGVVRHSFTKVGVYNVSVTAINPLGSVTKFMDHPVIVQVPPRGLSLDQPYYIIHQNSSAHLHASVTSGTNVSFLWTVAGEYVEGFGEELLMTFPNVGTYLVTVEASNLVTDGAFEDIKKPTASARVFVQQMLKIVKLCVASTDLKNVCGTDSLDIPLDDEVTFEAEVIPPSESALRFIWDVGLNELKRTNHPSLRIRYRDPGWYSVNVTVQNHISSASSASLKINLIQRLLNLTAVHVQGPNLLNQSVSFSVFYWFGTDLTFEWNFGDESDSLVTNSSNVRHIYHRLGEYIVTVHACNKFSKANISTNIFILDHICQKPELSFSEQNTDMIVFSTEDILFEPLISIVCELHSVGYHWTLRDKHNGSDVKVNNKRYQQRELLIPPHSIPIGEYTVELKVFMPHTIVHNSIMTTLHVVDPKHELRLVGGFMRSVTHSSTINMTVEQLDDRNTSFYNFQWHCTPLNEKHIPCFPNEVPTVFLGDSASEFSFPISLLHPKIRAVVIDVSANDVVSASQVLDISAKSNQLLISVDCFGCNGHSATGGQRRVLRASCSNCDSGPVRYTWQIWLIQKGRPNFYFGSQECVQADGSTFYMMASNSTEEAPTNATITSSTDSPLSASSRQSDLEEIPPFPILPGLLDDHQLRDKRKRRQISPDWFDSSDNHLYPHLLDNLIIEGETFFDDNFSLPEEFMDDDLSSLGAYHEHPPYGPHFPITEEGAPGEGGSAAARDQGQQVFGRVFPDAIDEEHIFEGAANGRKDLPAVHSESGGAAGNEVVGDPIRDNRIDPTVPHLMHHPRIPLMIDANDTTTGLNSEYLILKPHILRAGYSYMVQVTANSEGGEYAEGMAMDHVVIGVGPNNGRCTLMPISGYSIDQIFRLHCLEWKSENSPVYYELTYALEPDGVNHLIYFGPSQNVKFVLPPGYAKLNYSVYLAVTVWDRHGAATKVCSLTRQVKPKPIDIAIEYHIYNETFHKKSYLNKMLREKSNQAALQKMQVLVAALNLESPQSRDDEGVLKIRKELRWYFLKTAESLILYSKAEFAQLTSLLGEIIMHPDELDGIYLNLFVQIFSKLLERKWQFHGAYPLDNVEQFIISALSNLAATSNHMISTGKSEMLEVLYFAKHSLTLQMKDILGRRLRVEEPIRVERLSLSLTASYITSSDNRNLITMTKHTKIIFPNEITSLLQPINKNFKPSSGLGVGLQEIDSPCLAVVAEEYSLLSDEKFHHPSSSVQNRVVNHKFFTCRSFENILVEALPGDVLITTQFRDVFVANKNDTHFLSPANINIHMINIDKSDAGKALHFHIQFGDNETAPLVALFSFQAMPNLKNHILKFHFDAKRKEVHLNIPAEYIRASGNYYLSLMSASVYNDYSVQEDFDKMEYKLSAATHSCIQKIGGSWTYDGCETAVNLHTHDVECRCHSLVGVSVVSLKLTTEISVVPFADFVDHYANPLIIAAFLFVVISYLLLLIPNYYGDYNRKVGDSPIPIKDFKASHHQKYLITVCTGFCHNAGTTSQVYVVLHGSEDVMQTKHLIGLDETSCFHRGSTVMFIISTRHSLGRLLKLEIWHNNSGSSPSWFLSKISVRDLVSDWEYLFPCDKWLSVSKANFRVEQELLVSNTRQSFTQLLKELLLRCLYQVTIWNSVTCNVPTSTFSGIQRLTCCLCFLLDSSAVFFVFLGCFSLEDTSISYFSSTMVVLCLCTAACASIVQLLPALLFSYSQQADWDIFSAVRHAFQCMSLENIYCCLQGKYSFRSSSLSNSDLSYSDVDSMFSTYSGNTVSSSSTAEQSSSLKEHASICTSHASLSKPSATITNFDRTMITWQAIENWTKNRQNVSSGESHESGRESLQSYVESFTKRALHRYVFGSFSGSSGSLELTGDEKDKESNSAHFDLGSFQKPLPVFFYYLSWNFLIAQFLLSSYVNLFYIIRMNHHQSLHWLKAMFLCTSLSVFMIYPFVASLCAVSLSLFSYRKKKRKTSNDLTTRTGESVSRRYIDKKWLYFMNYLRPPTEASLIASWTRSLKRKSVYSAVRENCQNVLLLLLLLLMTFGFNYDLQSIYRQKRSIETAFIKSPLNSVNSARSWLSSEMMDTLYGSQKCIDKTGDCGVAVFTGCYPITNVVLQKRDKGAAQCQDSLKYHSLHRCYRRNTLKEKLDSGDNVVLPWKTDTNVPETDEILTLNSSRSDAFSQIIKSKLDNWINEDTQSIKVMMTLFNPTFSNLYSIVLTLKSNHKNQFSMSNDIVPFRLQHWSSTWNTVQLILKITFVVFTFTTLKSTFWRIAKSGFLFWKTPLNCFEVLFMLVSFLYVVVSTLHLVEIHEFSDRPKELANDWSRVRSAAQLQMISRNLLGLVFFLHLLRCVRVLKLDVRTSLLMVILRSSWKLLILFGVIMLVFAFNSCAFYKTFPTQHHFDHNPFVQSITAFNFLLKPYSLPEVSNVLSSFSKTMYLLFIFALMTINLVLVALVKAALISSKASCSFDIEKEAKFSEIFKIVQTKVVQNMKPVQGTGVYKEESRLPIELLLQELEVLANQLLNKADEMFEDVDNDLNCDGDINSISQYRNQDGEKILHHSREGVSSAIPTCEHMANISFVEDSTFVDCVSEVHVHDIKNLDGDSCDFTVFNDTVENCQAAELAKPNKNNDLSSSFGVSLMPLCKTVSMSQCRSINTALYSCEGSNGGLAVRKTKSFGKSQGDSPR